MNLIGIFEHDWGYDWMDHMTKGEMREAKYFADDNNCAGYHRNVKSALYDDMTDYIDQLQDEENLVDGELYVVRYFEFEECSYGLLQCVDFGLTKDEIIENVKNQKYVEGAIYFTMGQMFYTTRLVDAADKMGIDIL